MNKVAIVVDSSCDIDEKMAKELDVHLLRMPIIIDGHEYIEGVDVDLPLLKKSMRSGHKVRTAQVKLGEFIEKIDKLMKKYDEVIFLPISSGLSGMCSTANIQARNYNGRLHVVDAHMISYPLLCLVKDVRRLLDEGYEAKLIVDMLNSKELLEAVIIPEDIIYLYNGGRISAKAMAIASVLKIVPTLYMKNGIIDLLAKSKTRKKAVKEGLNELLKVDDYKEYRWVVIHDEKIEEAEELAGELKEVIHQEVEIAEFGPIIISHGGPGLVAIARIKRL